jgi:hypothetical protein
MYPLFRGLILHFDLKKFIVNHTIGSMSGTAGTVWAVPGSVRYIRPEFVRSIAGYDDTIEPVNKPRRCHQEE